MNSDPKTEKSNPPKPAERPAPRPTEPFTRNDDHTRTKPVERPSTHKG
jgi:hypothetical protein